MTFDVICRPQKGSASTLHIHSHLYVVLLLVFTTLASLLQWPRLGKNCKYWKVEAFFVFWWWQVLLWDWEVMIGSLVSFIYLNFLVGIPCLFVWDQQLSRVHVFRLIYPKNWRKKKSSFHFQFLILMYILSSIFKGFAYLFGKRMRRPRPVAASC